MKEYNMTEQQEYYTFTKDVKTLIQYVQEQVFDHLVVEAANRLNWAIKKDLKDYDILVTPIKESKDSFNPKSYSGLNCKDAEHLIGKVVEGTNYPNEDWKTVKLVNITNGKQRSGVFEVYHQKGPGVTGTYESIRTCEKTFTHPTINICGVELPKPETVAPSHGTKYWISPDPDGCGFLCWTGNEFDISALKACRVHITKERAQAWADWWKKEVIAKIEEIDNE